MSMKNFNDTIGNRTRDLQTCSAVPQPTAPPLGVYYIRQRLILKYVGRNCCELNWCSVLILALNERGKPRKPQWLLPLCGPQFEIETSNIEIQNYYLLIRDFRFNTLSVELNPICYLLALLGAHHFLHISRIRLKSLTLRLLMSYIYIYICIYIYIYGGPILDVSRSHTTTHHSR